jgi:hypothetical protein
MELTAKCERKRQNMTTIQFTNAKGNTSAKVRNFIKDSTIAKITEAFEAVGLEAVINADKGLSLAVAQDAADGAIVFVHMDFTVSKRDPSVKTAKSKAKTKAKTADVELPDLFSEAEESDEEVDA